MGTAAFVMAELVGVNYWTIAVAGILPAFLFYLGIYATVHVIAVRQGFQPVVGEDLPDWREAMSIVRLASIIAAIVDLSFGIHNGNSVELTACYGMIAMIVAVLIVRLRNGENLIEVLRICWAARVCVVAVSPLFFGRYLRDWRSLHLGA